MGHKFVPAADDPEACSYCSMSKCNLVHETNLPSNEASEPCPECGSTKKLEVGEPSIHECDVCYHAWKRSEPAKPSAEEIERPSTEQEQAASAFRKQLWEQQFKKDERHYTTSEYMAAYAAHVTANLRRSERMAVSAVATSTKTIHEMAVEIDSLRAQLREKELLLGKAAMAIPEVAGPVDHRIRMIRTSLSNEIQVLRAQLAAQIKLTEEVRGRKNDYKALAGKYRAALEDCKKAAMAVWDSAKTYWMCGAERTFVSEQSLRTLHNLADALATTEPGEKEGQ